MPSLEVDDDLRNTLSFGFAIAGLVWYSVLWCIGLLGAVAAYRRYRNRPIYVDYTPAREAPGVSILRPLKGLDPNLYTNLESTFRQNYPNFEILFSVADAKDQAIPVVQELLQLYPDVKAQIVVGEEVVGVNPKVNNLVRPYRMAAHDIVWVLDSNVSTDPGTLSRAVEALTSPRNTSKRRIGVVHHIPFVESTTAYWGSRIEAAFLNTFHAKMYIAINTVAIESCVVGKSNLYRRSDVDRVNGTLKPIDPMDLDEGRVKRGFPSFGRFLAEDNMIASALWHELGLRHDLSTDVAYNVVGNMTIWDYVWRRVRWLRVRKRMVLAANLVEPFTESIMLSIIGSSSGKYLFGIPRVLFMAVHFVLWFLVDISVYKSLADRVPVVIDRYFVVAWLLREVASLPIWIFGFFGNTVVWRGQRYRMLRNGEVALASSK
ncbi:glucosylceramide synthase [Coprinopsis cinerea okayama7|uniref:Ceramide glucosyltransferase n=1 Tax=Coprinopsis cinerea (strain Okayama-7 / 130 / ATCC MYA-4618 / FGSC 9003) TaxID=240176 RepID=D6RK12_COPC7|nr:glucosylceramide synthase [Coprinopsis cinerea okayama7\|eukprot:XP_002912163.1 glucosylceramide synthase [Coprinopsis cinerea okayama7\